MRQRDSALHRFRWDARTGSSTHGKKSALPPEYTQEMPNAPKSALSIEVMAALFQCCPPARHREMVQSAGAGLPEP